MESVRPFEGVTSRTELRGGSVEVPDSIKKMLHTLNYIESVTPEKQSSYSPMKNLRVEGANY